MKYNFNQSN